MGAVGCVQARTLPRRFVSVGEYELRKLGFSPTGVAFHRETTGAVEPPPVDPVSSVIPVDLAVHAEGIEGSGRNGDGLFENLACEVVGKTLVGAVAPDFDLPGLPGIVRWSHFVGQLGSEVKVYSGV